MLKSEMKNKTVIECLQLIFDNQVNENAIFDLSKEKLGEFVLEVFNKGYLNNYLNLK